MRLLFILLIQLFTLWSFAQEKKIPDEARAFILPGYEVLDYIEGELNNDGRADAVLLLKPVNEDSLENEDALRPLLLFTRNINGALTQIFRNDSVVMCRFCGGVFGDPYADANIANNTFSIYFYGGSSWRWAYEYQFGYKPATKNWVLIKETQTSFQSGDPEKTMTEVVIEENELGEIPLSTFSSDPVYEDSRWKVKAAKTYFYSSPKLGSKPRKGYLVTGNIATGIRHLKNFIEVSFENSKSVITTGFILRKDLEQIK